MITPEPNMAFKSIAKGWHSRALLRAIEFRPLMIYFVAVPVLVAFLSRF
jgi:hypothetical protein